MFHNPPTLIDWLTDLDEWIDNNAQLLNNKINDDDESEGDNAESSIIKHWIIPVSVFTVAVGDGVMREEKKTKIKTLLFSLRLHHSHKQNEYSGP